MTAHATLHAQLAWHVYEEVSFQALPAFHPLARGRHLILGKPLVFMMLI